MLNSNHIVKRLFILLVLLVPIFLKAQDVGFGVKGGFNFSTLYIDDVED